MKKKFTGIILSLLMAYAVFAQDSKSLFTGVYDFATQASDSWKIYDGTFTKIDFAENEYSFMGGFVVKLLTSARYDFVCTVKGTGDDFDVSLTNMSSYSCDKNGNMLKNAKTMNTSANVAKQYASQMKEEIKARISKLSEEQLEQKYFETISYPPVLKVFTASMSDLAAKKFIESNINGKIVEFEVKLDSIDENTNPLTKEIEPLAYKAKGSFETYKDGSLGGIIITEPFSVYIYSNNDKLLNTKIGSIYKAKGKAKVEKIGSAIYNFWSYSVEEE